jgi:cullin-associated NEDD8-dissociated protein 1
LTVTEALGDAMSGDLPTAFTGELGEQFEQVAKAIRMDVNLIDMERAGFFTSQWGYDSHGSMDQSTLYNEVNSAIASFVTDMKQQGKWDNVVMVFASDFGRTLTSNTQGTDHGWGGNYFVLGGKVNGGQMLGLDPIYSDEDDGRARIIPSTPWESIWNGIAEWFGVDKESREEILPMMKNFDFNRTIFTAETMFKA